MKGVDAVVHTASPVAFGEESFGKEHLDPAVNGTRGVLEAVAREEGVKSVVTTSSYGESPGGRRGWRVGGEMGSGRKGERGDDRDSRRRMSRADVLDVGAVGDHRTHPNTQAGRVIDEDDWNPYTIEELEEMVKNESKGYVSLTHSALPRTEPLGFPLGAGRISYADPPCRNGAFSAGYLYYMGAKKYAEKEAWSIQERTGHTWSLATMNATMIFGPPSE